MSYLSVESIQKSYNGKTVLDNVSFTMEKGTFLSILGESGCGKTTLLKIIAGLVKQEHGHVYMESRELSDMPTQKRQIAMVFQDYALFPHLSAVDNVAFSLKMKGADERKRRGVALEYLNLVQLDRMAQKYPHELSGGQKQRVAIARALVAEPRALLLDEPFSSLDANLRSEMCGFIKEIQQSTKMTTVMVTHDRRDAMLLSDRMIILHEGRIVQQGPPEEIYRFPENAFTARFMGELNLLDGIQLGILLGDTKAAREGIYGIRPESISISTRNSGDGIAGIIKDKRFLGERLDYVVEVNGVILDAATLSGGIEFQKGQKVYLNIPSEGIIKTVR